MICFSCLFRHFLIWCHGSGAVPRFTGKTRITGKTAEIPERQKNNRGIFIGVALIESIPDLFYLTLKQ